VVLLPCEEATAWEQEPLLVWQQYVLNLLCLLLHTDGDSWQELLLLLILLASGFGTYQDASGAGDCSAAAAVAVACKCCCNVLTSDEGVCHDGPA
jgi:hypothetical protein